MILMSRSKASNLLWLDEYVSRLGTRYPSIATALEAAGNIPGGWDIVETGSIRTLDNWQGDGCSTILLARFADETGRRLYTVDKSRDATLMAMAATSEWSGNVFCVTSDSHEFLRGLVNPIGLAYFDSMDWAVGGRTSEETIAAAKAHQLQELVLVYPHLVPRAVVVLDDNPHKTELAKALLKDRGAECLVDAQQSVWRTL